MRANPWFPKTLYVFLLIRWAQQQFRWPQLSGHVSLASPSSSTMSTMPQRLKRSALSMKASSHSQWQTRALRWHSCIRSVTPLFSPSSTSGHAGNCRSLIPFHSIPRSARKMFLALCSTLLCWTWAVLIQASGQSFRACRVTLTIFLNQEKHVYLSCCEKKLVVVHLTSRSAAYNLLCALTCTFNLKIEGQLLETSGLCIPANNTLFIVSISKTLAANEPHLTLEFLEECISGFSKSSKSS